MLGRPVPPYEEWPIQYEKPPTFAEVESIWTRQAAETRAGLAAQSDWGRLIEYRTVRDGRPIIITTSPNDLLTQLALHEVHHRAQVMCMLRQLGVAAEDIDFNALMHPVRDA
jgi:uncharacterized damage-inducible protein DinB